LNEEKHRAIEGYLGEHFPDAEIVQSSVGLDRGYKIFQDGQTYILKVTLQYLMDNSLEKILSDFQNFDIAKLLRESTDVGILVTRQGVSSFDLH